MDREVTRVDHGELDDVRALTDRVDERQSVFRKPDKNFAAHTDKEMCTHVSISKVLRMKRRVQRSSPFVLRSKTET